MSESPSPVVVIGFSNLCLVGVHSIFSVVVTLFIFLMNTTVEYLFFSAFFFFYCCLTEIIFIAAKETLGVGGAGGWSQRLSSRD